MSDKQDWPSQTSGRTESNKRRRELLFMAALGSLFVVLSWILFKLFGMSEQLPFEHSIFFFGLVNFNIILFLLLMFLIFRNIVKQFAEREGGPLGSSLKSKLIAAFVAFSFVPTALMFVVSVFYINNSFDRWFNEKITGVLKSSMEVTNSYYQMAKKKNYHFAQDIAQNLQGLNSPRSIQRTIDQLREKYRLDAVEYYPDLFADRYASFAKSEGVPEIPPVSLEFLQKGLKEESNSSFIHHFNEGDLVRVMVPLSEARNMGAIVVSAFIPMSLVSRMDDIAAAFDNIRDSDSLSYPIKSIYLIILVLMTLVILLCATWFGFYLARQLSIPLEELASATQRVVKGDYKSVQIRSGSPEINRLISNFNIMTEYIGRSEREIQEANVNLRNTLSRLDDHSRYVEVVVGNVTTGVVSLDAQNVLTMINRHATSLLNIKAENFVGKNISEVLDSNYYTMFTELLANMRTHSIPTLSKEIQVNIEGRPLILSMTISLLRDDQQNELGKVIVFDDMTPLLSAQRASAWAEVARRIAHEIKNPLTPISLAAQRLQRKFGDSIQDPAFADCTRMIVEQVDGLKALVNEFSQFARMPQSEKSLSNFNQVVVDALQLFHQGERAYSLKFHPDPKLPEFLFDTDQIRRVVTNLVDNAVESCKGLLNSEVVVEVIFDPLSKVVRLSVADNGKGISKSLRERIFEPYMTTKKHGTGLGLAIVKRTVEDHGGYVRVQENHPMGTRFVIELPVILSHTSLNSFSIKSAENSQDKTI